jgi:antitoxin CcdA
MNDTYDPKAAKKPANLSVNSDLLKQARELQLNLSATLEEALAEKVRERRRDRWLMENREAIAAYNEHVERHGVFSERLRSF